MYRIIYVSFEPGDGYIDDLIVPKMNGFSFETVFDAEQYLKKCEFPQIRNKHRREVCLGCKDELHFETIKHEGYEVRYSFNVICYGDLIERNEFVIVDIGKSYVWRSKRSAKK